MDSNISEQVKKVQQESRKLKCMLQQVICDMTFSGTFDEVGDLSEEKCKERMVLLLEEMEGWHKDTINNTLNMYDRVRIVAQMYGWWD